MRQMEDHDHELIAGRGGDSVGIDPVQEALRERVETRLQRRAVKASQAHMGQYSAAVSAGVVPPTAHANHPADCVTELLAAAAVAATSAQGGAAAAPGAAGEEAVAAPNQPEQLSRRRRGPELPLDAVNKGVWRWAEGLTSSMALMEEVRRLMNETSVRDKWTSLVEYWEPGGEPLPPDVEGDADADALPAAAPTTSLGLVHWDAAEKFVGRKVRIDQFGRMVYAPLQKLLPDGTNPGDMRSLFEAPQDADLPRAQVIIPNVGAKMVREAGMFRTRVPPPVLKYMEFRDGCCSSRPAVPESDDRCALCCKMFGFNTIHTEAVACPICDCTYHHECQEKVMETEDSVFDSVAVFKAAFELNNRDIPPRCESQSRNLLELAEGAAGGDDRLPFACAWCRIFLRGR